MLRKKKSENLCHDSEFGTCLVVSSFSSRDKVFHMFTITIMYLRVLYKEI
jgi:hypothetical protein